MIDNNKFLENFSLKFRNENKLYFISLKIKHRDQSTLSFVKTNYFSYNPFKITIHWIMGVEKVYEQTK